MRYLLTLLAISTALTAQTLTEQEQKRIAEKTILFSSLTSPGHWVKGKPFTAEAVTETVQVLTDGNQIVRRNRAVQYRDRSGRTRREQTIETLGPSSPVAPKQLIFISDPVAKTDYILDPAAKTVRKSIRFEGTVNRASNGIPTESSELKKEDLGKRTIEGLECTGTRTTATISAGRIGNERPIVAVTEMWYSADLEAVVQSTTIDPRFGETRYTVRGVQRTDQPAQLFDIPADYRNQ